MRAVSSKRLLRKISRIKLVTFYLAIARLSMMLLGVIQDETPQPP
jgi:hypothetical protein